ncbi:MAG: DUF2723 domain-containing protein, partial [candidate division Zixibacteria bacterium]|nr:DUF2723 domain-containing protein [candidate division Zixibacteria bacterium]
MDTIDRDNRDWIAIFATAAVFVNAFITYLLTMTPSIPFWDCGEFIACSYTLGVAHPPGTPLFLLLGRVFILINPFFEDIAARMNFISVLVSAAAVALSCLIIIKLLKYWFKEKSSRFPYNALIYLGAITGALAFTYSSTFWFSAIEAEVYGTAMLLMQLLVYLTLLWYERRGKEGSWRYLLLVFYIAFLSIAVHMTVFLVMPAIILFILYSDRNLLRDWRFWALAVVILSPAISFRPFLAASIALAIISIIALYTVSDKRIWRFVLTGTLLAILGFSVHLYIPLRSMDDPYIDMNDPETYESFSYFMERKQYGDESMITRMFDRRGSWENQFGNFHNLGFWFYFKDQFSKPNIVLIPFILGLLGLAEAVRRDTKRGLLLGLLVLLCTVGLVLYMNFSDGLHGERMEVRDRDYFFTPGFMFFAMLIGLGVSALGAFLYELLAKRGGTGKILSMVPAAIMLVILIFQTAPAHWTHLDRTGVYVPGEYAYNILNSCEENAILFTNGDNDTYPLWCLQAIDSVRADINVMNLSLLNTDWYILQHKHQHDVPIPLDDDQIEWEFGKDRYGNLLMTPKKPYIDPITKQKKYLSPNQVNVKAEMVKMIIINNNWKRPIYLAATVSDDIKDVARRYLHRKGMVYKVTSEEHNGKFDVAATDSLLNNVYKYTNLDEPDVGFFNTELSMSITYPETYIALADQVYAEGDTTKAIDLLLTAKEKFPYYFRTPLKLKEIYLKTGRVEQVEGLLAEAIDRLEYKVEKYPEEKFWWMFLGPLYMENNQTEDAIW